MSDTILGRAIRGLSTSLRFTGSRTGPVGIDLSRASTPVNDLTQYARYGSALVFNQLQDGWVSVSFLQPTTEAGFDSQSETWDTQVSGSFGIAPNALSNMMCWIYMITLNASANTAAADIGISRVSVPISVGIGGGTFSNHKIWLNDGAAGSGFVTVAPNNLDMINKTIFSSPFPWGPGSPMDLRVEQIGVNPRTVNWTWTFLCRLVPFGVPPLP